MVTRKKTPKKCSGREGRGLMGSFSDRDRQRVKAAFASLLDEDVSLLVEKGTQGFYRDHDTIIEEGSQRRLLLVLLEGRATIVRTYLGSRITIAAAGPGETIGEIGFLDGKGASASVIADGPARTIAFEPALVQSLMFSVPGLAARLFQSLGGIVAARLRLTNEMIPPLIVEDVPQVNRFHAQRSTGDAPLPPSLIEAVEEFKQSMLHAQLSLKDRKAEPMGITTAIRNACTELKVALAEHVRREATLSDAIGTYTFRETFPFMMASRFQARCYMKPRGYAGDFETINIIYDKATAGDGAIGKIIDEWALDQPPADAVRSRRGKIASDVLELVRIAKRPVRATSLAVGPGRELFDVLDKVEPGSALFVGIDIDDLALNTVAHTAEARNATNSIRLHRDNLIKLSVGRGATQIDKQDFIYTLGLIDYLQDRQVIRLIDWCFDNLAPGGRLALGNFAATNPDKAFMDHVFEWVLIHRTPEQLQDFFAQSKFGSAPVRVDQDASGIQLFAYCQKP
jgi:CRP-like cAMP-binding protein